MLAELLISPGNGGGTEGDGHRYLRMAADGGIVKAQLWYASLLRDASLSALYYKRAADQGSLEGQLKYAEYLIEGYGVEMDIREAERYLKAGSESREGDGGRLEYGIALACGRLGRFDFVKAFSQFSTIARSNRLARRFVHSLSDSNSLISAASVSEIGTIFALLRHTSDGTPLIRSMNDELCERDISSDDRFEIWMDLCRSCFRSLIDISHRELGDLSSWPSDLLSCTKIAQMIPLLFKMYSKESSLYQNVNHFLRSFPLELVSKFEKELGGILSYIALLQSSIHRCSVLSPLTSDCTVYRGFGAGGASEALLYETIVGEVIVWGGFSSTSLDRDYVISRFVGGGSGLLFEISLPAGAVAVPIADVSVYDESEILIAASTGFLVESVEWITVSNDRSSRKFKIPCVRLSYFVSWSEFDLDRRPPRLLL
jgi:hypothetical protein